MMSLREQIDRRNAGLPPPCVETSDRSPTLSVLLPAGETWVLAWSRFGRARLRGEELTLTFDDQEVVVRGHNLPRIMEDVAALRVECPRTIPATYRAAVDAREPVITEIEIRSGTSRHCVA